MPFIQVPGVNLHYEHHGQGETVIVLVHGNFASWRWWIPLLMQLPSHYRAYVPEMRGFGDSEKPNEGYHIEQLAADLRSFIKALKLPRLHLVGHSLGGAVCLQLAIDFPGLIQSLTLVSPAPAEGIPQLKRQRNGFSSLLPHFSSFTELQQLMNSLEMNRSFLKRSLQTILPTLDTRAPQFTTILDDAVRLPPQAITGFIDSLAQWDVSDDLPNLNLPVLIIAGKQEQIVDLAALERMAKALPNAELHIWERAGHAIPLEQVSMLRGALVEFIEQQTPPPASKPLWKEWQHKITGKTDKS